MYPTLEVAKKDLNMSPVNRKTVEENVKEVVIVKRKARVNVNVINGMVKVIDLALIRIAQEIKKVQERRSKNLRRKQTKDLVVNKKCALFQKPQFLQVNPIVILGVNLKLQAVMTAVAEVEVMVEIKRKRRDVLLLIRDQADQGQDPIVDQDREVALRVDLEVDLKAVLDRRVDPVRKVAVDPEVVLKVVVGHVVDQRVDLVVDRGLKVVLEADLTVGHGLDRRVGLELGQKVDQEIDRKVDQGIDRKVGQGVDRKVEADLIQGRKVGLDLAVINSVRSMFHIIVLHYEIDFNVEIIFKI